MTAPCTHERRGIVTSLGPVGRIEDGGHAQAPVCDLPECINAAMAWVARMSGKEAHHVLDGGAS